MSERAVNCNVCPDGRRRRTDLLEAYEIIAQLRAQLRSLSGAAPNFPLYPRLKLNPQERGLVNRLVQKPYVSNEEVMHVLRASSNRPENRTPNLHTVQCRLRDKLEPFGIRVRTQWGTGRYFTAEDKQKLKELE
jgi:hypothetical protein